MSEPISVHVTTREGEQRTVTQGAGHQTLMQVLYDEDIGVEAICGGCTSCATCHVIVDPDWYARTGGPSEDEEDMLDLAFSLSETSRLGCQIAITPELDGLRLTVPEDF